MPVLSASILDGATCAFSGGTAKAYAPDGLSVANGVHIVDTTVTDPRTRPGMTLKSFPARLTQDNTWSNGKRAITVTRPKVLTDGTQRFPGVRIELTDHPEMSAAEVSALRLMAAEALMDTDFDAFWSLGSLN